MDPSRETWDALLDTLMRWSHLGVEDQRNGTRLIGRVPHVGPLAWFHQVYRGLNDAEIRQLEDKVGLPLPDQYRAFLTLTNGLNVFSDRLSIFGMPRSFSRTALNAREPYDLAFESLHARRFPGILCIGGLDSEFIYCRCGENESGEVQSCRKTQIQNPTRKWPDFWTMLTEEISRLARQYGSDGRRR